MNFTEMKKVSYVLIMLVAVMSIVSCSDDDDDDNDDISECEKVVYSLNNYDRADGKYEIMVISKTLWDLAFECSFLCPESAEIESKIENAREKIIVDEETFFYYLNQDSFCSEEYRDDNFSCLQYSTEICWEEPE